MKWPYKNIDYNELDIVIKPCEQIIVSLGGTLITAILDNETWVMNEEKCITE